MAVTQKYQELINAANTEGVSNLQVREQDNVLYIDGTAPTATAKERLWDLYGKIDPEFRGGDLVMNLLVAEGGEETYTVVSGDNLTKIAKRYPGLTWKEIYEANRDLIKDPDLIQPGWKLKIPAK